MKDIATKSTTQYILDKYDLYPKKKYGQNFLIDPHVVEKIVRCSSVNEKCAVIEVGPGIGALTQVLARYAGYVRSYEIDTRFKGVYEEFLNQENIEIVFEDFLKVNLEDLMTLKDKYEKVILVANLPYYITSPIIMMLLENELPIDEIVVMVQKEAGERLCAEVGTRQAGAVSVAVNFYASGEILFDVPRESFMPSPKVDSVVIKLVLNDEDKYQIENKKKFFSLVKCAFAQRRKTALNSISNTMGVSKQKITEIFNELGLEINIRPEKLTMQNLIDITDRL